MSWNGVELWQAMILKVIPHFILKNAHLIKSFPRIICTKIIEDFGKKWTFSVKIGTFGQKTNVCGKKLVVLIKSSRHPKKELDLTPLEH